MTRSTPKLFLRPAFWMVLVLALTVPAAAQKAAVGKARSSRPAENAARKAQTPPVDNAEEDGVAPAAANSELRQPTAAESEKLLNDLKQMLDQSTEDLVAVPLPDGGEMVDLQGRFQSVALAKVGPDGKVQMECVTTLKEAKEFLEQDGKADTGKKPASPRVSVSRTPVAKEQLDEK
jgi:uncharacterized membrane protein YdfJ with MMPL/SSD domain